MAQKENNFSGGWRADFFAGLAVVLPIALSLAFLVWVFFHLANVTDYFLFFLPQTLTHEKTPSGGIGEIAWYWSFIALLATLLVAFVVICLIGRYGRFYLGRKMIQWMDHVLMRIPLLNKIYGTIKQVNDSFTSNKSSFKQVVLVSFPHGRSRAIGFVTGEQRALGAEKLLSVFIPTTPIPTSGFLLLVPETEIVKLDISVAEGIKFIISLGVISPDYAGLSIAPVSPEVSGAKPTHPALP